MKTTFFVNAPVDDFAGDLAGIIRSKLFEMPVQLEDIDNAIHAERFGAVSLIARPLPAQKGLLGVFLASSSTSRYLAVNAEFRPYSGTYANFGPVWEFALSDRGAQRTRAIARHMPSILEEVSNEAAQAFVQRARDVFRELLTYIADVECPEAKEQIYLDLGIEDEAATIIEGELFDARDAPQATPARRSRGMSQKRFQRAELFKGIKDNNPHLSYEGVAGRALRDYRKELVELGMVFVTAEHVRNDYRAMGWEWLRADRIR